MAERIDIRIELATTYRGIKYWYAHDDLTYDYAIDTGGRPQGSGTSKWAAVRDLIDTMEEEDDTTDKG